MFRSLLCIVFVAALSLLFRVGLIEPSQNNWCYCQICFFFGTYFFTIYGYSTSDIVTVQVRYLYRVIFYCWITRELFIAPISDWASFLGAVTVLSDFKVGHDFFSPFLNLFESAQKLETIKTLDLFHSACYKIGNVSWEFQYSTASLRCKCEKLIDGYKTGKMAFLGASVIVPYLISDKQ